MANFPIASGHPDLSNLKYIPQLYASRLLVAFYAATCLASIANTDYEGQVKDQGDKVIIRTLPQIDIKTYTKGQPLEYQNAEPSNVELLLDKGKYWAFNVDDVDYKQSDIAYIDDWAKDGATRLKIAIETGVFSDIYDDVSSSNAGATAGAESSGFNLGTVSYTHLTLPTN